MSITVNGWNPTPQQKLAEQWVESRLADQQQMAQTARSRSKQYSKAYQKANRNTKIPLRPNNTAKLQDALWQIGAFKGVKDRKGNQLSYEKAVDGIRAKNGKGLTEQAIANAQAMGYKVNENTGTLSKRKITVSGNKSNTIVTSSGPNIPQQVIQTSSSRFTPEVFMDNLYPYGYSDDGTILGGFRKVVKGLVTKDPKRKAVDEFVNLNLKNPEERKRATELSKQFTNFSNSNLEQMQQSMRHRLDANNLYLGREQQFGSWIINPDYESPSATAKGIPTYTYSDPRLRKQQQNLARRHGMDQGEGLHSVQGDITSVFNNYSVNRMHPDGSGRYVEKWDFIGPNLGRPIIIGDTIPSR